MLSCLWDGAHKLSLAANFSSYLYGPLQINVQIVLLKNTGDDLRLIGQFSLVKEEAHCCNYTGYFIQLAASVLLYIPTHRQDSSYLSICYSSCGTLDGTRNSSMSPP